MRADICDRIFYQRIPNILDEEIFEDEHDSEDHNSSGSSFVPSSDDESDGGDENDARQEVEAPTSCNASMDLDASLLVNKVGHSAPDDMEMVVRTVEDGTKKDWCPYCKTEQGKLSRHLARKHKTEEEVAKFLSFRVGDERRKPIIDSIRKRGHFLFNADRAVNTGERKVKWRPNARYQKVATDFATCPSCYADYARTSLCHHYRRCAKKNSAKQRSILQSSKKITGRLHLVVIFFVL